MARACLSNGWWTHPQGISIRTIEDRSQESRAPGSAVQGREQTWPQSMRNSSERLWRCHVSSCLLETVKEWGNYESWRKTSPERWKEARSPQKQLHSARRPPALSAPCAVGTATRALACTVTQDVAATPPIDKCLSRLPLAIIWWWWCDDNDENDDDSDSADNVCICFSVTSVCLIKNFYRNS